MNSIYYYDLWFVLKLSFYGRKRQHLWIWNRNIKDCHQRDRLFKNKKRRITNHIRGLSWASEGLERHTLPKDAQRQPSNGDGTRRRSLFFVHMCKSPQLSASKATASLRSALAKQTGLCLLFGQRIKPRTVLQLSSE